MKFIIGDKVRFLDSKEKGIVSKIINEKMVMVEIESDFEIPVATNQLVFDGVWKKEEMPEVKSPEILSYKALSIPPSQKDRIYICFECVDENKIVESDLNVIFVNTTSYDLAFSYFNTENNTSKWLGNKEVVANSKVVLTQLKRNKINEWKEINFQIIFFRKESFTMRNPEKISVKLRQEKLFQEESFKFSGYANNKAIEKEIFNLNAPNLMSEELLHKHLSESIIERKDVTQKTVTKQSFTEQEMEIDLHIEELLDNYSGMTNFEIVQFQLNYLQKKLDNAITKKMKKLIVIHGVGNGKLKTEVHKMLLTYQGIRYFDASYQKYGYGATQVVIY